MEIFIVHPRSTQASVTELWHNEAGELLQGLR